jgi:hypothetical protein
MPTYKARDLANRITNVFFMAGGGLPRETYTSIDIYNYIRLAEATWDDAREASTGTVGNNILINNSLSLGEYNIARTGIQFTTTWDIIPVGMKIYFTLDNFILPTGGSLKIQAFKGTSLPLSGDPNEYAIPLDQGLIPYSDEVEINGVSEESFGPILYFNQTAIDAFLANPDQNIFILGEYDYNNIAPTDAYTISDLSMGETKLDGQT